MVGEMQVEFILSLCDVLHFGRLNGESIPLVARPITALMLEGILVSKSIAP